MPYMLADKPVLEDREFASILQLADSSVGLYSAKDKFQISWFSELCLSDNTVIIFTALTSHLTEATLLNSHKRGA